MSIAASASGCVFSPEFAVNEANDDDGNPPPLVPDSGPDLAIIDGGVPDAGMLPEGSPCATPWPYAASSFDPCDPAMPVVEPELRLTAGEWTYDTATGELREVATAEVRRLAFVIRDQPGAIPMHICQVQELRVDSDATLTVFGPLPWYLGVHDEARVEGLVLVKTGTTVDCDRGRGARGSDADDDNGAGGGGGGGHVADGGDGGDGALFGGGDGGNGGANTVSGPGAPIRPGCPGGAGGNLLDDDSRVVAFGGFGGAGGGAMQLVVRDRLRIEGDLLAVGGGGQGGEPFPDGDSDDTGGAGGGGGGAGGDLLLEADVITVSGRICAGGGAGGVGGQSGEPVVAGEEGGCVTANVQAGAGLGDGGDGSVTGEGGRGGRGTLPGAAGGGGGGSAGRIQLRAVGPEVVTGIVQPEPIER